MVAIVERKLDFKPLHDYVLFEEIPDKLVGLTLPEGTQLADVPKVRIVAVGPGYRADDGTLVPMDVKAGDVAYMAFANRKPLPLKLEGKKYGIVRARDLVAMLVGDDVD